MKKQLVELLKKVGLYTDEKKAEIDQALAAFPDDPEPAKPTDPLKQTELPKEVREALADVGALKESIGTLQALLDAEKKQREAAEKAMREKIESDTDKKIDEFMKKHETRIPPSEKDEFRKNLKKDFDGYAKLIEKLPEDPAMKKNADGKDKQTPGNQTPKVRGLEDMAPKSIMDQITKLANVSDN